MANDFLPSSDFEHHSQDVSISELIEHGSISFGRFAVESLAWEKWSVFSHNRCQEELEKFKAPGLVAQKKAYFEEYFKKIKAIKTLQAEQQETDKSVLSQEESCTVPQVENIIEVSYPEEEKTPNDSSQIGLSEPVVNKVPNPVVGSRGTVKDESVGTGQRISNRGDIVRMEKRFSTSSSTVEPVHFAKKAAPKPAPVKGCVETSQIGNLAHGTLKPGGKELKDHTPLLKPKGSAAASARNKTKLDYGSKKDAFNPAEKREPTLGGFAGKQGSSLVLSGKTASKGTKKIETSVNDLHCITDRPFTNLHPRVTGLHHSCSRDKPASSTCIRGGHAKSSFNTKSLGNKNLPNKISTSVATRNMDLEKRRTSAKPVDRSGCHMIPKQGQFENQKSKSMATNSGNRIKQIRGSESGHSHEVKRIQKEVVPLESADITNSRRDLRCRMPSWR